MTPAIPREVIAWLLGSTWEGWIATVKTIRRFLLLYAFALSLPLAASILPVLPHPNADELTTPVFLQTFAGLNITSFSNGVGTTEPFFDTLPPGAISGPIIMSILGNFQAFDPFGNPVSFNILGVHVTQNGSTFTPAFGSFDFAGHPSVTFTDSQTFDTITFNAGDATLAFSVPNGQFQFTIDTDLALGSSIVSQITEPQPMPEPMSLLLMTTGLAVLTLGRWRRLRHKSR